MRYSKEFIGETLGTFLLVLFGCGSVAVSVLFKEYQGILQIAIVWGIGVTLAIYLTRHLSCAHLNPAVSLAMVIGGILASLFFVHPLEPAMKHSSVQCNCCDDGSIKK